MLKYHVLKKAKRQSYSRIWGKNGNYKKRELKGNKVKIVQHVNKDLPWKCK